MKPFDDYPEGGYTILRHGRTSQLGESMGTGW